MQQSSTRRYDRRHPEITTNAGQCIASAKRIRRQAAAGQLPLIAGGAQGHIYKVQHDTAMPAYLCRHLYRTCVHFSAVSTLYTRTDFVTRGFHHSSPAVWNSLRWTILDSSSHVTYHLLHLAHSIKQ